MGIIQRLAVGGVPHNIYYDGCLYTSFCQQRCAGMPALVYGMVAAPCAASMVALRLAHGCRFFHLTVQRNPQLWQRFCCKAPLIPSTVFSFACHYVDAQKVLQYTTPRSCIEQLRGVVLEKIRRAGTRWSHIEPYTALRYTFSGSKSSLPQWSPHTISLRIEVPARRQRCHSY